MKDELRCIDIAVCSSCNLRCKHCYQPELKTKGILLNFQTIKEILLSCNRLGAHEAVITGGEPLCHPDIFKILDFSKRLGYNNMLLTNATLINEKIARILKKCNVTEAQVSLEGPKEIHEKIRGKGTFDRTVQGIRFLTQNNIKVTVNAQLTEPLFSQMDDFENFLGSLGVTNLAYALIGFYGAAEEYKISTPTHRFQQIRELFKRDLPSESKRESHNLFRCAALHKVLSVSWEGSVYPCEFFRSIRQYSLGSIYREPIDRIYKIWIKSDCDLNRYFIEGNEECKRCAFRRICIKCPARIYSKNKNFKGTDMLYCLLFGKKKLTKNMELSKLVLGKIS